MGGLGWRKGWRIDLVCFRGGGSGGGGWIYREVRGLKSML